MPSIGRHAAAIACVAALTGCLAGALEQRPASPGVTIALTFDDLPVHGPLPPGLSRLQLAQSIVGTLTKYGVPEAYGFVNARTVPQSPDNLAFLKTWRAAGFPLANHAFSHMDLHTNTAEAFERDVLANEPTLGELMGSGNWRWFRFPYLREGDTIEKYDAVRTMLDKHGYTVAQVTVDFADYAFNDPYVRCLALDDRKSLAWLEEAFLTRAAESLVRGQDGARSVFGRDIPHVMLLHVGAFHTIMLPRLLDLIKEKGFTVVRLQDAQKDAAYATKPQRPAPRSGTLLNQLATERIPASPAWSSIMEQLGTVCRTTSR